MMVSSPDGSQQVVYIPSGSAAAQQPAQPQPQQVQQPQQHYQPPPPVDALAPLRQASEMFSLVGGMASQIQQIGQQFAPAAIAVAPAAAEPAEPPEKDPFQTMEVGGTGGFPVLINRETKKPSVGLSILAGIPQITEFGKTVFQGVRDSIREMRESEEADARRRQRPVRSSGSRTITMDDDAVEQPQQHARVTSPQEQHALAAPNGHSNGVVVEQENASSLIPSVESMS
jgi:hypothetical protein